MTCLQPIHCGTATVPALLSLPLPLAAQALRGLEHAARNAPQADADLEYASWFPDPGALEFASWDPCTRGLVR